MRYSTLYMYQTIHESIEVAGVFTPGKFSPTKFRWGKKTFAVEAITLLSRERDGLVPIHHYSVVASGTVFRLSFHPDNLAWFLEEVWQEGA